MPSTPRGIRNNNPGNLRDHKIPWIGLVGADDAGYCQFDTMHNGMRAAMRDMHTDWRAGQDTIRSLVVGLYSPTGTLLRGGWAPRSENNTDRYMDFISDSLGIGLDEKLRLDVKMNLCLLARGIFIVETGRREWEMHDLAAAATAALEGRK